MKKRIAIVGYGGQGAWHASWAQKSDVLELAGIYDIRENMFMALPDEWQDNVHAVALDNGFEIINSETEEKIIRFEEKESINDIQVNTYSYAVYMGARLWHLECDESMDASQVEYVYKSITDLN